MSHTCFSHSEVDVVIANSGTASFIMPTPTGAFANYWRPESTEPVEPHHISERLKDLRKMAVDKEVYRECGWLFWSGTESPHRYRQVSGLVHPAEDFAWVFEILKKMEFKWKFCNLHYIPLSGSTWNADYFRPTELPMLLPKLFTTEDVLRAIRCTGRR